jgi:hypothetical protein
MNKEEILYWNNKYDIDYPWWTQREKELGDRFRQTKMLTKVDLCDIVEWKFKELPARRKRVLGLVGKNDDGKIRSISDSVFNSSLDDSYKMDCLQNLDGVRGAVASTILTLYNPKDYGVFDIHVWREFFGKERKGEYLWTTKNYLKLLTELRRIANQYNLDARTVEKAFYKKNYDESNLSTSS